jgi:hypothetical protein
MSESWENLGSRVALPHYPITWLHAAIIETFLVAWGLTLYLNGLPLVPYYVNLIIYSITLFLAGVCAVWFALCPPGSEGDMGGDTASVVSARRASDRFYWYASFATNLVAFLFVLFVFVLDVGIARDPTVAIYNITNATLADGHNLDLYEFSQATNKLTIYQAAAHWVYLVAGTLAFGASQLAYLMAAGVMQALKVGRKAPEGVSRTQQQQQQSVQEKAAAFAAAAKPTLGDALKIKL